MVAYIIDQIVKETELRHAQIHQEIRVMADTGQRGIQLSIDVCHKIVLPRELKIMDHQTSVLQFADIFEPDEPFDPLQLVQINGINYEPIQKLAQDLERSIRLRNVRPVVFNSADNYDIKVQDYIADLTELQLEYQDTLSSYLTMCRDMDVDDGQLEEAREELDETFDLISDYNKKLQDVLSYKTTTEFLQGLIDQHEQSDKVNKLRLRLELVRELIIDAQWQAPAAPPVAAPLAPPVAPLAPPPAPLAPAAHDSAKRRRIE